jgi:LacI family repressor for deo operon, udp, cdd, tsx, nupC, and nupG
VQPDWILEGGFTNQGGYRAGRTLLNMPGRPTAVFCGNDESALGLLKAASELAIRVPQDLSVVGFDNSPITSATFPTITTVRQPLTEIGAAAITALVNFIESGQKPEGMIFDTELIVRASTASPS